MIELLHRPGFLGTRANFGADATLLVMIFIAALFSAWDGYQAYQRYAAGGTPTPKEAAATGD